MLPDIVVVAQFVWQRDMAGDCAWEISQLQNAENNWRNLSYG
jgi:hypothetical protein